MATALAGGGARTSYREVFAVGEFRVLFAAISLRVLAASAEILALSVLVYAQTGSALLSAVAYGIGFLPQLVGGALFTSLADQLPARPVLVTVLLVRAAPGAVIGLLNVPVWAMLVFVAVVACTVPVATATSGGLLPALLSGDRYVLGRSLVSITGSGMQIVGLGIGGAVLAVLSARQLLLVAAAALVLGAIVVRLRLHNWPARADGTRRAVVRGTFAGNRRLLADRSIRSLLLVQWLPGWFVTGAEALIVPYVASLGRPASTASALLVALPVGMLAGDVVVGRWCRPRTRERLAFPLVVMMGLPLVVFVLRPSVPIAVAMLIVTGSGFGYQNGVARRFVDVLPADLQGQAFGLRSSGLMAGLGAGPAAAGALAAVLGTGAAMAAAGAACALTGLALRDALTGRQVKTETEDAPPPHGRAT